VQHTINAKDAPDGTYKHTDMGT